MQFYFPSLTSQEKKKTLNCEGVQLPGVLTFNCWLGEGSISVQSAVEVKRSPGSVPSVLEFLRRQNGEGSARIHATTDPRYSAFISRYSNCSSCPRRGNFPLLLHFTLQISESLMNVLCVRSFIRFTVCRYIGFIDQPPRNSPSRGERLTEQVDHSTTRLVNPI